MPNKLPFTKDEYKQFLATKLAGIVPGTPTSLSDKLRLAGQKLKAKLTGVNNA